MPRRAHQAVTYIVGLCGGFYFFVLIVPPPSLAARPSELILTVSCDAAVAGFCAGLLAVVVGCTACDSDCGGLLMPFTGCAIVESLYPTTSARFAATFTPSRPARAAKSQIGAISRFGTDAPPIFYLYSP